MVDLYGGLDPRPTQRRVMKCRKRFICVAGNRYPGKTTAAEWKIMDFCLANPGVEGFIGRWEKTRLYSTTIALWRKLFPVAEKGEEPTEWNGVYKFVPEDSLEPDFIKFKNGSLIHILNLQKHADKLRGDNFSGLDGCRRVYSRSGVDARRKPALRLQSGQARQENQPVRRTPLHHRDRQQDS